MTALGKTSPRDVLKLRTWRLINIQSGETIAMWGGLPTWDWIVSALERDDAAHWTDDVHCAQIETEDHPLENAEYITVNGSPVAFVSWDASPISAGEMRDALFPSNQYAEAAE